MKDTTFESHLSRELEAATALASEEVKAALPSLVRALGPAVAQLRQEILVQCAAELNDSGITSGLYVRMTESGPVFATESTKAPIPEFDDDPLVRMTLRLPQALRDSIGAHVSTYGGSINSWIVAAVREKLAESTRASRHRLSGWSV